MSNVVVLADRRPSRFASVHPDRTNCDCAACDVRRMGRTAEQLRTDVQSQLLVDGNAVADRVDELIYRLAVLCGLECQRLDTPETGQ